MTMRIFVLAAVLFCLSFSATTIHGGGEPRPDPQKQGFFWNLHLRREQNRLSSQTQTSTGTGTRTLLAAQDMDAVGESTAFAEREERGSTRGKRGAQIDSSVDSDRSSTGTNSDNDVLEATEECDCDCEDGNAPSFIKQRNERLVTFVQQEDIQLAVAHPQSSKTANKNAWQLRRDGLYFVYTFYAIKCEDIKLSAASHSGNIVTALRKIGDAKKDGNIQQQVLDVIRNQQSWNPAIRDIGDVLSYACENCLQVCERKKMGANVKLASVSLLLPQITEADFFAAVERRTDHPKSDSGSESRLRMTILKCKRAFTDSCDVQYLTDIRKCITFQKDCREVRKTAGGNKKRHYHHFVVVDFRVIAEIS